MGPVHLLQEEIVQKDLFKPPKDIFYSIEQKGPETKTAKKHFLDNINIEKEEPLQVRNSVNSPYVCDNENGDGVLGGAPEDLLVDAHVVASGVFERVAWSLSAASFKGFSALGVSP